MFSDMVDIIARFGNENNQNTTMAGPDSRSESKLLNQAKSVSKAICKVPMWSECPNTTTDSMKSENGVDQYELTVDICAADAQSEIDYGKTLMWNTELAKFDS